MKHGFVVDAIVENLYFLSKIYYYITFVIFSQKDAPLSLSVNKTVYLWLCASGVTIMGVRARS